MAASFFTARWLKNWLKIPAAALSGYFAMSELRVESSQYFRTAKNNKPKTRDVARNNWRDGLTMNGQTITPLFLFSPIFSIAK
jgi:hypothetical protein